MDCGSGKQRVILLLFFVTLLNVAVWMLYLPRLSTSPANHGISDSVQFVKVNVTGTKRNDTHRQLKSYEQKSLDSRPALKKESFVLSPKQQTKWRTKLNSLHTCLDALNLTRLYKELQYYDKAEHRLIESLQNYFKVIRHEGVLSRYNYCYPIKAQLTFSNSQLKGFVGNYSFETQTSAIDSFVLRNLRSRHESHYQHSFNHACLPKVYLAGFPKCGSTFLHEMLESHSLVLKSSIKEPHQWDKVSPATLDFETLTANFALYMYNYKAVLRSQVAIDASPQTLSSWPHFEGEDHRINICLPPVLLPALIPNMKLIVVMRNPVAATYSLFWFSCTRRHGTVPKELLDNGPDIFHERAVARIAEFKQCQKKFPSALCMMDMRSNQTQNEREDGHGCGKARMDLYLYYIHIQKWLAVYPRKQFMFVTLEELSGTFSSSVMEKLFTFIGIPSKYKPKPRLSQPVNEQQKVDYHHDPRLVMREDTKVMLEEFFRPFNMQLAELLMDTKFLWSSNS